MAQIDAADVLIVTPGSRGSIESFRTHAPVRLWRLCVALTLGCLALFVILFNGRLGIIDGELMYRTTESIVERRSLAIEPHRYASQAADGRYYSKYGPLQSVLAIPLYVVGRVAAQHAPGSISGDQVKRAAVSLFNPIFLALLTTCTFSVALRFGLSPGRSLAAALLATTGTSLLYLSKTFNSEPLTALMLLLAVGNAWQYGATRRAGYVWLSGVFLGLAIMTRQVVLLAAPVLVAYVWFSGGRSVKAVLQFAAPVAATGLLLAGYNYVRFGSPLQTGYGNESFTTPVWVGVPGLLFSPRCGILFYSPMILLAIPGLVRMYRTRRREASTIAALALIWLISSGAWWCWYGGWAVGPRLLLPVFPLLAIAAAVILPKPEQLSAGKRALLLAAFAVNLALQVLPLSTAHPEWRAIELRSERLRGDAYWDPQYMPLLWQIRNLDFVLHAGPKQPWPEEPAPVSAQGVSTPAATAEPDEGAASIFNVAVIDGWPAYLRILGFNPILPLAGVAVLLIFAAACFSITLREARRLADPSRP